MRTHVERVCPKAEKFFVHSPLDLDRFFLFALTGLAIGIGSPLLPVHPADLSQHRQIQQRDHLCFGTERMACVMVSCCWWTCSRSCCISDGSDRFALVSAKVAGFAAAALASSIFFCSALMSFLAFTTSE